MCAFSTAAWKIKKEDLSQPEITKQQNKTKQNSRSNRQCETTVDENWSPEHGRRTMGGR